MEHGGRFDDWNISNVFCKLWFRLACWPLSDPIGLYRFMSAPVVPCKCRSLSFPANVGPCWGPGPCRFVSANNSLYYKDRPKRVILSCRFLSTLWPKINFNFCHYVLVQLNVDEINKLKISITSFEYPLKYIYSLFSILWSEFFLPWPHLAVPTQFFQFTRGIYIYIYIYIYILFRQCVFISTSYNHVCIFSSGKLLIFRIIYTTMQQSRCRSQNPTEVRNRGAALSK